jgi:hypothetical protein
MSDLLILFQILFAGNVEPIILPPNSFFVVEIFGY